MQLFSMVKELNWVDGIFIVIFLSAVILGFSRGFIREVLSLITLVIAFFVASMFSAQLADALSHTTAVQMLADQSSKVADSHSVKETSHFMMSVCFAGLFLGTACLGFLITYMLNLVVRLSPLSFSNSFFGACFGFLKAALLNLAIIFIIQLTSYGTADAWKASVIVDRYQPSVARLSDIVSPELAGMQKNSRGYLERLGL